MAITRYTVEGMSCGHCVAAVQAELGRLPGVKRVDVDLATGAVTVESVAPVDAAAVATAVEEAGYQVVS
jgi:copper ion binding protein